MFQKTKYTLEYTFNTSPKVLFERLSTPSGLAEWFADDVNIKNNIFTFIWDGSQQEAELLTKKPDKYAKFRWIDDKEKNYFEFKIEVDDLTGGVALIVTDFANENELVEAKELWDYHISELKHTLGILK
ncbi:MAG: SRPBCC domain-containing protein [Bacteroidia bacterium]|nr:SRPBCC domain-containing protein [Bacteroidia bacterium]